MSVPLESLPAASRELVQLLRATLAGRQPEAVYDWETLLQQATWHGVDAFLFPALASLPAAQQPPPAIQTLWRRKALASAAASVRREAQLRELLGALAGAHIRTLPLKGSWLAAHVYPEPGQRAMDDIDVLVPREDLPLARDLLARLGYVPHGQIASLTLDADQSYTCPRHAWPVELHWQLGVASQPPLHQPAPPGLWQRVVAEPLLGVPGQALCPEEHLVFLAYHVLHHRLLLPLRGYLDLALLSRTLTKPESLAALQIIAAEWGMECALPRILALAADLFDQALPMPDGVSPDDEAPVRHQAIRDILQSSEHRALPAERTLLAFRRLGLLARMKLLRQRIFMPREFLRREYACARWQLGLPLAYLLRAQDLLQRHAGRLHRTLQHEPQVTQQLDLTAEREKLLFWALSSRSKHASPP